LLGANLLKKKKDYPRKKPLGASVGLSGKSEGGGGIILNFCCAKHFPFGVSAPKQVRFLKGGVRVTFIG